MVPAFLISLGPEGDWSQAADMDDYGRNVPPIVKEFGGTYVLGSREVETLEGATEPGPVVVIEFPSLDALNGFYRSDAYRPWLERRQRFGKTRILVVNQ